MIGIYFAHFVSLCLYFVVIVVGVLNLRKTECIEQPYRKFFIWYIIFAILTCIVFISLQLEWILNNQNENVGEQVALWWLIFDFLNGMAYLSGMVALGVVLDLYKIYNNKMNKVRSNLNKAGCMDCIESSGLDFLKKL